MSLLADALSLIRPQFFAPDGFYHRLFTALLPKGSRNFIIDRDPELIRQVRKENVHDRNFLPRVKLYRKHAEYGYAQAVDNNGEIEIAVDRIVKDAQAD